MSNVWSPEEDKKFRAMWLEGKSASQISRALSGRTRNAVLGRVFRLGLPQRVSPIGAPRPKAVVAAARAKPQPAPVVEPEDPGPMKPPITTIELRDHHCKWPYDARGDDYHYCGQPPKDDRPFCPYHCGRAYQPKMTKTAA